MSSLRNQAEIAFAKIALKAVQEHARANDGRFPADLGQLKPYFDPPIDDAMLHRYMIAPASGLSDTFAIKEGEWVITQKAPVNPDLDRRSFITLSGLHPGTSEAWDLFRPF